MQNGICPQCETPAATGQRCASCNERHCVPLESWERYRDREWPTFWPELGHMLDGYLVVGFAGRGGFGQVFEARRSPRFSVPFALKVPTLDMEREKIGKTFEVELRSLERVRHPHVVTLLDGGEADGKPYMVAEWLDGITLRELMSKRGSVPAVETMEILHQVLLGLQAAHELGVYHRDVSPSNVMLQPVGGGRWHAKVVDFGLAKQGNTASNSTTDGKVGYKAPEQFESSTHIDARTDVYSVGVLAFEMLTGRMPWVGHQPAVVFFQRVQLNHSLDKPLEDAALDADLTHFIARAAAVEPSDRYVHAALAAQEVGRILGRRSAERIRELERTVTELEARLEAAQRGEPDAVGVHDTPGSDSSSSDAPTRDASWHFGPTFPETDELFRRLDERDLGRVALLGSLDVPRGLRPRIRLAAAAAYETLPGALSDVGRASAQEIHDRIASAAGRFCVSAPMPPHETLLLGAIALSDDIITVVLSAGMSVLRSRAESVRALTVDEGAGEWMEDTPVTHAAFGRVRVGRWRIDATERLVLAPTILLDVAAGPYLQQALDAKRHTSAAATTLASLAETDGRSRGTHVAVLDVE